MNRHQNPSTAPALPHAAHPAPRGRWAPSPTGLLHVGNARTALVAWLSVRSAPGGGGRFLYRLEDLDPPRILPGAEDTAREDLAWLGLDWDEGPDQPGDGGPVGPYRQSERTEIYLRALETLAAAGRIFPCDHSRREVEEVASAPHGREGPPPYPKALRPRDLPADWWRSFRARELDGQGGDPRKKPGPALRFLVEEKPVVFDDLLFGRREERVDETVGDFVLRRRDGLWAYQLAVVADDLAMGVTEVVRGADLLASTARQIQLFEALGTTPPTWGHVPLVLNAEGEKLSKRDGGLTLASLREAGVDPRRLVGWMGWSLGLLGAPEPCRPEDLIPRFAWRRLPREDHTLPAGFAESLARGTAFPGETVQSS